MEEKLEKYMKLLRNFEEENKKLKEKIREYIYNHCMNCGSIDLMLNYINDNRKTGEQELDFGDFLAYAPHPDIVEDRFKSVLKDIEEAVDFDRIKSCD